MRWTGRPPSGLPTTKAVPTNPKTAAVSAGPQPPIHTTMAIAPIRVAYGTSDSSHGMSNQRRAIAAVTIASAIPYLAMRLRISVIDTLALLTAEGECTLPPKMGERREGFDFRCYRHGGAGRVARVSGCIRRERRNRGRAHESR